MKTELMPFNIDLLILKPTDIQTIRPIKVLDITDGLSKNFHPDGLFSLETFGRPGEEKRNRLFSYIDIKADIFHPIVYKAIIDLKSFYEEIISGKGYAIFNETLKDFEKSDQVNGETGYDFFVKHFQKIQFPENRSSKREFNIKLVNKYRLNSMMNKYVVIPAGIRDYTLDDNNKPSEDDINTLYRKILSISNLLDASMFKTSPEYFDTTRYNLQLAANEVYAYLKAMVDGKNKMITGKWVSRNIYNSTRNVLVSYIPSTTVLQSKTSVSVNHTVVGIYQYLREILPLAVKFVREEFLTDVFIGPNSPVMLVNKQTLQKESVQINSSYYDDYMSYEGLEKLFARFAEDSLRSEPVVIGKHYLGLIYKGPDNTYKFLQDIRDVPDGRNKKDVFPITYVELCYLSIYKYIKDIPSFVTRYPITGEGSIYPTYSYLKTTIKAEQRKELDSNWNPTGNVAIEYPLLNDSYFNGFAVANCHLQRLVADFNMKN